MLGRNNEITILETDYDKAESSLIVCYGRRRIGKSFLLNQYIKNHLHFQFEGIEDQSPKIQIRSFVKKLITDFNLKNTNAAQVGNWEDALDLLTQCLTSKKIIIFLDEFQWITSGRSILPALLKRFWDNDWKKKKVQLILCGSVSSYMIGKVIKSKALYGRINLELKIDFMPPSEARLFFNKEKSAHEIMKYLIVFGGTPKYLADIKKNLSFEQNIAEIFFRQDSGYLDEFEKVFYSQFREHKVYEKIVGLIAKGPCNLVEISKHIGMNSGGGLKSYLQNLELARFIKSYPSDPLRAKSKIKYYRLVDPFLRFYFAFVFNSRNQISHSDDSFKLMKNLTDKRLDVFLGLAFENFCLLHAMFIAKKLGIADQVQTFGPFAIKNKAQIDLLYVRNDQTINIVEIKFQHTEITPSIMPEIENKITALQAIYPRHSIQKSLVTLSQPSKQLKASGYFDQILTVKQILS